MNLPWRRPRTTLKVDRPLWLAPAHIFKADHLAHAAHLLMPFGGLVLIFGRFLHGIEHRHLDRGGTEWILPPFRIDSAEFETWVGLVLIALAGLNTRFLGRVVRWRHSSTLLPTWNEEVAGPRPKSIGFRYASTSADVDAVLRYLDPAFPRRWFLPRPLSDRKDQLCKLLKRCPRAILMMIRTESGAEKLVGCSVIAPLEADAYWDYRNGRSDNWRIESKDFAERSSHLLSNYLFSYRKAYRVLLRDMFIQHVVELGPRRDPRVVIIAPRLSSRGQRNMERLGGHYVGTSIQQFPLFELDLRNESELNDAAHLTLQALRRAAEAPTGGQ